MRVFVTGATGFIGRALVLALRRRGYAVVGWVRCEKRARNLLGDEVEFLPADASDSSLAATLSRCDAIINLAGEAIFGKRWSQRQRKLITESRVSLTSRLATAVGRADNPPKTFLSGSAVGFYGHRGGEELDESAVAGDDFLASVCKQWEQAAEKASSPDTRVVCLRTGIVLGQGGGALEAMLPAFRSCLGGPLGDGLQFVPWIHLEDCVALIISALENAEITGPLNVVGPAPMAQRDFAGVLGRLLRRPSLFTTPRLALRAILGEAASALLSGQRCLPSKAKACGFRFQYESLESALADLIVASSVAIGKSGPPCPPPLEDPGYLRSRSPRYFLRSQVIVHAPLKEVFPFFSKAANLGLLTPPKIGFIIHRMEGPMEQGALIEYRLRIAGFKIGWRSRIERWDEGKLFVDSQEQGPYRAWWHEHHFISRGEQTLMEDRVYYSPPLGLLGRIAHRMFIASQLRRAFHYRAAAVRLRFGASLVSTEDEKDS